MSAPRSLLLAVQVDRDLGGGAQGEGGELEVAQLSLLSQKWAVAGEGRGTQAGAGKRGSFFCQVEPVLGYIWICMCIKKHRDR